MRPAILIVLSLCVLLSCSSEPERVKTKKTCCSAALVAAKFCDDEVAPGPRSHEAGCEVLRSADSEFFVRFHRPPADWPWRAVDSDEGSPDGAVFLDSNLSLLQDFGVELTETVSKTVPITINGPAGPPSVHSFVEHFAHEIAGARVLGDKSFISRNPSGDVRTMFFRWHLDAGERVAARSADQVARDDASLTESTEGATLAITEQQGLSADLAPVWVPMGDGIRLGVRARWFADVNGEPGTGSEAVFVDGIPFESPDLD